MPLLAKDVISRYVRTECKRQLRLYLTPDTERFRPEREAEGMPPPQPPRPGLEQFTQAGEEWQAAKLADMTETFGEESIVGDPQPHSSGQTRYRTIQLADALGDAREGSFLIEAEFEVGPTFQEALGIRDYPDRHGLEYRNVRPDIVEVLPPGHSRRHATAGGETRMLPAEDDRLQLRVIDIKLTAEPSAGYFAEVAFYTMALAGWLSDVGLDHRFVAVPDGAVWPGSHDAAHLTITYRELVARGERPTREQLRGAMEEDLEPVPFEVFAFRLRRFFQEELPEVLSSHWQDLDWHVDNRCSGCENLGYPWRGDDDEAVHPDHCMPEATRTGHLSRVAFVSRGASGALRDRGVTSVDILAGRPSEDPVFGTHQTLRATRTVVSGRARSLGSGEANVPPGSGSSAVMPRWTDLRIYLSVDFDIGSAITFALGVKAFWYELRPFGSTDTSPRQTRAWDTQTFVVDSRSLEAERRELLAFLDAIRSILSEAENLDHETKVQVYLWDSLEYDHLTRIIGRHLQAILDNREMRDLAWLFPPENLLPNARISTRRTPITMVREVVRAVLAAPIAHYYTLLETARNYHRDDLPENVARFGVHPLFEDALSDQIPSERAHEIWSRSTDGRRNWLAQLGTLQQTTGRRLSALEEVTRKLGEDLRDLLPSQAAPRIRDLGPPARESRLSWDGQLWYAFARLDAALDQLEVQELMAMPPHQREAKFECARLPERLAGTEETSALQTLGLSARSGRHVYRLSRGSREVKLREGDISMALAPEDQPEFLDRNLKYATEGTALEQVCSEAYRSTLGEATEVSVAGIDRDALLIAVDGRRSNLPSIEDIERAGIADFGSGVVLDKVHHDYFTSKLLDALRQIGNPPAARENPLVRRAVGQLTGRGSRQTAHNPPADFLWGAGDVQAAVVERELGPVREELERRAITLNATQWRAWERALSRRLTLVWGPPGTGKSRTARAVILGAALEAHQRGRSLRVLVCAQNYNAMDNVLLNVNERIGDLLPEEGYEVYRLRSYLKPREDTTPDAIDTEVNRRHPNDRVRALVTRLDEDSGVTVVGSPPSQVYNLLKVDGGSAQQALFDLILIDEASQMDVPLSILPIAALADGGSVVLAGDPKQLPPIQQAEAPLGLEAMVGSVYAFCEDLHGVDAVMLDENYRSNATLVDFSLEAGYRRTLSSFSPNLRLSLTSSLPTDEPDDWPGMLHWTHEWTALLDPNHPASCFVYPEGRSSQWNLFEADAVAALIFLLRTRAANRLSGERNPASGETWPAGEALHSPEEFWTKAVGVVTPHRAQQGLIIGRLQQVFPEDDPALIRGAVDTVERFQGQERDVIVASYALGDPDAIGDEDEFLMSLNRFNVMSSRARSKLIVLVSQEIVDHLSGDLETLRESRLLKNYVDSFCRDARPMTLGFMDDGTEREVPGTHKHRATESRG